MLIALWRSRSAFVYVELSLFAGTALSPLARLSGTHFNRKSANLTFGDTRAAARIESCPMGIIHALASHGDEIFILFPPQFLYHIIQSQLN